MLYIPKIVPLFGIFGIGRFSNSFLLKLQLKRKTVSIIFLSNVYFSKINYFLNHFFVFVSFKINNITEDVTQWDHIGQTQSDLNN
jgi:hypothetical protein